MEGAYASANEAGLEGQRIGPLQLRVAILCGFAQMFDGYDISSIGMVGPSLSHAWNVAPAAFATVRHVQCRRHGGRAGIRSHRRSARPPAGNPHQPVVARTVARNRSGA
jgi:hypothetical protein